MLTYPQKSLEWPEKEVVCTNHNRRRSRYRPWPRRSKDEILGIRRILGKIGVELGDSAERYTHEVFTFAQEQRQLPPWLLGWERQEKHSANDQAGVDFIFRTDVGDIDLQVKSSRRNAERFIADHPDSGIAVAVVNILDPKMTAFWKILNPIRERRKEILQTKRS